MSLINCYILYYNVVMETKHENPQTEKEDKMDNEAIVVFTAKSVETCLEVGGTQSWVLNRANAKHCKYAILCRNANTDWGDGKEPHGTAFMIGRISDVVPSTENEARWLVKFDQYARLDKPNFWQGWRNPVRYTTLEELSFTLDDILFEQMPKIREESKKGGPSRTGSPGKLTIIEAKKALAFTFGVKPEAVEIIIHG